MPITKNQPKNKTHDVTHQSHRVLHVAVLFVVRDLYAVADANRAKRAVNQILSKNDPVSEFAEG